MALVRPLTPDCYGRGSFRPIAHGIADGRVRRIPISFMHARLIFYGPADGRCIQAQAALDFAIHVDNGAKRVKPNHIDIRRQRRVLPVVEGVPDFVSHKSCANPAVWQTQGLDHGQQMPTDRIGAKNAANTKVRCHQFKLGPVVIRINSICS